MVLMLALAAPDRGDSESPLAAKSLNASWRGEVARHEVWNQG